MLNQSKTKQIGRFAIPIFCSLFFCISCSDISRNNKELSAKKISARLENTKVSFDFTGMPLHALLEQFSRDTGISFILDPYIRESMDEIAYISIPDHALLSVKDVLQYECRLRGVSWIINEGEIHIVMQK